MKQIPLSQNKFTLVDDEDYDLLMQWKWYFSDGYARRKMHISRISGKQVMQVVYMARTIMGVSDSKIYVDHIDGDKLNNQKSNLRLCTQSENNRNRKKSQSSPHKYKGVYPYRHKWKAVIRNKSLGVFETQELAAIAYNNAAIEIFGGFALLNEVVK